MAVRRLAEEVAGLLAPRAEKNGNRIALDLSGEVLCMRADEGRFRQVLVNLVGNACKSTTGGEIRLEVRRRAQGGAEAVDSRRVCELMGGEITVQSRLG